MLTKAFSYRVFRHVSQECGGEEAHLGWAEEAEISWGYSFDQRSPFSDNYDFEVSGGSPPSKQSSPSKQPAKKLKAYAHGLSALIQTDANDPRSIPPGANIWRWWQQLLPKDWSKLHGTLGIHWRECWAGCFYLVTWISVSFIFSLFCFGQCAVWILSYGVCNITARLSSNRALLNLFRSVTICSCFMYLLLLFWPLGPSFVGVRALAPIVTSSFSLLYLFFIEWSGAQGVCRLSLVFTCRDFSYYECIHFTLVPKGVCRLLPEVIVTRYLTVAYFTERTWMLKNLRKINYIYFRKPTV